MSKFKIQYGEIYSPQQEQEELVNAHLKSSMERFIGYACKLYFRYTSKFKIQYGEIYRETQNTLLNVM